MSAYRVIDKLEIVVREGIWMPFGWRAVNSDQVLDLIEKLRSTLPEDAGRSKKTNDSLDRDALAASAVARDVAQGRTSSTSSSAATQESDALARAQSKADAIVADAQTAAREIRRGADEYADHVLASLDVSLGKALAAVQKGRQTLASSTSSGNGKTPREMSSL
ncbi:MAG: hypothetical protein M3Z41_06160 [Candidatus Eremiobacteraeota bacterium]|nr:hypothetical protein [Candidatus Eremiobacteraeota bacterium]